MYRNSLLTKLVTLLLLFSMVLSACIPSLRSPTVEPGVTSITADTPEPTPTQPGPSVPQTGNEDGPPAIVFSAAGDIQSKAQEFRTLLGADNGGEPGGKGSGRREVNWDGVPEELAAPKNYRGDFFNASIAPQARGLVMSIPGNQFMVSAGSDNPAGTPILFGNLNPTYVDIFKAFSGERIFTPINRNVFEIGFYEPGTDTAAAVRAFGAVFVDVDGEDTFLEFFDPAGTSLGRYRVPAADSDLSFLGVVYEEPLIARVRVKLGNAPIGLEDGDGIDIVVMDDFIYSEPRGVEGVVAGILEPPKAAPALRETQAITETETISTTETPVAGTAPDEFLLNFDDVGDQHLSSVNVDLTGLAPAPEGKSYAVWLKDISGNYRLLGEAIAGQTFLYNDPAGRNLISQYRAAALSLEDSEAVTANTIKTPSNIQFEGEIPAPMIPLLQKLVVAATDTPGDTPYGYGLQEQAAIAAHHGQLLLDALNGGDLAGTKAHLEHIWNTMEGFHSSDFGDQNGDGRAENPGDGFGVLLYASRMVGILDQIAEMPGVNEHYQQSAANAGQCTRSIVNKLGPEVKNRAQAVFPAQDTQSVMQDTEALVGAMNTIANGFDLDGNGIIDRIEGECGAAQVNQLVRNLYHVHMARAGASEDHDH